MRKAGAPDPHRFRSAITGRFVSAVAALRTPRTTIRERVWRRRGKSRS